MKKIINLVLVVLLLTTFSVSANNANSFEEDLPKAVKVMSEMIKKNLENFEFENEALVDVIFTVNSDNELVILNVKTNDIEIKNYIKSTLNSLKIEEANLFVGKNYSIKINFTKSN
ncbi:hypothetical protein [Flavobacterium terrigena]|uniref:Uncharacterized protein n=1 Tax=Flavobacterium terrigena TaxID=402734 RepID=A0A1H6QGF7_9FLAO|nr:hypothetical protein [Flavobacterium terrigena]SEI38315.1 hypothetical protein SAMN05660918_0239 [Flavobacterium terrigena]